jgi:DNA polymerase III beta subunit, central domain
MSASIPVPAAKLRDMLAAVLPHVCTDDTLPSIMGVLFEVAGGVLYLAATDRYSIGVARHAIPLADEAPVPDHQALLGVGRAQELHKGLERADGTAVLVLRDGQLIVDHGSRNTWKTSPADFPGWRGVLRAMLAAGPTQLDGDKGIAPRLLARFAAPDAEEWNPWDPGGMRVRIVRPEAPAILVTREDWFIGAAMGVRIVSRLDDPGRVAPAWDDWAAVCAEPEPAEDAQVTA